MRSWPRSNARGLLGPATVLLMLATAACAASDLRLDLSSSVPMQQYATQLQALQRCEPGTLHIDYSLGSLDLIVVTAQGGCRLRALLEGELREDARPQEFACDLETIRAIDWLRDANGTRMGPPLREVRSRATCVEVQR